MNPFPWIPFYEAMADRLLAYKNRRDELVQKVNTLPSEVPGFSKRSDHYPGGDTGPMTDICPFTTMGIFNRGSSDENRTKLAQNLADFLHVDIPAPTTFTGIPIFNNQKPWVFAYADTRQADDIDLLWTLFEQAIILASTTPEESNHRDAFIATYNEIGQRAIPKLQLTIGLFWIRPNVFLSLDGDSKKYLNNHLNIPVTIGKPNKPIGTDYLALRDQVQTVFSNNDAPVHGFAELAQAAKIAKAQAKQKAL